jgi:hypothetical protein
MMQEHLDELRRVCIQSRVKRFRNITLCEQLNANLYGGGVALSKRALEQCST